MKTRILCCFLTATLLLMSLFSTTSTRPFALQQEQVPHFSQLSLDSKQAKTVRGLSRLGSRPPNCAHKCQGCVPCNAIQIPATTDQIGVQYANYEPEGWKCKCGTSFFNP